ncbi:hypothetical protein PIB30_021531 [Stylosanthes scabra]|uniref:Uncharacterized protein n=1 Tax=Stylosanthes scabra TaxID=79078 RepID=A0ABU6R996_9FABA|nr:hypothetical protein [Stylosanthes scabra]
MAAQIMKCLELAIITSLSVKHHTPSSPCCVKTSKLKQSNHCMHVMRKSRAQLIKPKLRGLLVVVVSRINQKLFSLLRGKFRVEVRSHVLDTCTYRMMGLWRNPTTTLFPKFCRKNGHDFVDSNLTMANASGNMYELPSCAIAITSLPSYFPFRLISSTEING